MRKTAIFLTCLFVCALLSAAHTEAAGTTYLWPVGVGTGAYSYTVAKGTQAAAVTEEKHGGTYAMKVWNKTTNVTRIWIEAENLTPEETYTASAWVKIVSTAGVGALLRVSADYKAAAGAAWATSTRITTTNGAWRKLSLSFTQPADTTYATLTLDTGAIPAGDAVYWDDATIAGLSASLGGDFENVATHTIPVQEITELPTGVDSIVQNDSFETPNGVGAANWTAYGGWVASNPNVTISTEYAHSDARALKITATDAGTRPWCSQMLPVTPLTEYVVSAWVYCTALSSGDIRIKFECYNTAAKPRESVGASFSSDAVTAVTGGTWVELRQTFYTIAECGGVAVMPRLYGTGTVYFDDIAVYPLGDPSQFAFSTDGEYYYEDDTAGLATATLTNTDTGSGKTVDFSLCDGDRILQERKGVAFTGTTASFAYSLELLTTLRHAYTVAAILRDAEGIALETQSITVYKYERSPYLRADGVYLKDKETPFYPVIAYHVSAGDYPKMAEAGINTVQVNFSDYIGLRNSLNAALKNNIMCLVALYRNGNSPMHPDNLDITVDVLERFKNHPAVLGWMVMDEPFGALPYNQATEALRDAYKLIRDIDTEHPVYTLDNQKNTFAQSGKYVDILATDPYPAAAHDKANYVASQTAAAVAAVDAKKPVYIIMQAFEYFEMWPTSDQMRSMPYQAMFAGAAAVGYYAVNDARVDQSGNTIPLYDTDLWDDLVTLAHTDYPVLYETPSTPVDCTTYKYCTFEKNGERYLAVYSQDQSAEVPISVDIGTDTATVVAGGSGSYTGIIDTQLVPCGTLLCRLTPQGTSPIPRFYQGADYLTALPLGDVTAKYTCTNSANRVKNATLYVALYKTEGDAVVLTDIRLASAVVASQDTADLTAELCVTDKSQTMRAFAWFDGMLPCTAASELK